MPTGLMNLVADNSLSRKLLDWKLRLNYVDVLRHTIKWYYTTKDSGESAADLERYIYEKIEFGIGYHDELSFVAYKYFVVSNGRRWLEYRAWRVSTRK